LTGGPLRVGDPDASLRGDAVDRGLGRGECGLDVILRLRDVLVDRVVRPARLVLLPLRGGVVDQFPEVVNRLAILRRDLRTSGLVACKVSVVVDGLRPVVFPCAACLLVGLCDPVWVAGCDELGGLGFAGLVVRCVFEFGVVFGNFSVRVCEFGVVVGGLRPGVVPRAAYLGLGFAGVLVRYVFELGVVFGNFSLLVCELGVVVGGLRPGVVP
jgi:hypothetical protein